MGLAKKIILGVIIYMLFMLSLFPARVALSLLALPKSVAISGVSGTIWQGSLDRVAIGNRVLEHVRWNINFAKLFTGTLSSDLVFGNRASMVNGKGIAALSFSGISLSNLRVELPSEFLIGNARLPFQTKITGALNLIVPEFKQGLPWCESLEGKVFLDNLSVSNQFGHYPLGNIALGLACDNGDIQASIDENGNKLGLQGLALIKANNKIDVNAKIRETSAQPKDLTMALSFLGRPDAEGYYSLNYQGKIPNL